MCAWMSRKNWHILRDETSVTVTRRVPAAFDVSAKTLMPAVGRRRLAQQIRQDLWRELRGLRGFAPVVKVESKDGQVCVTAGGTVRGAFPRAKTKGQIEDLLANPQLRARWSACAAHREVRHD